MESKIQEKVDGFRQTVSELIKPTEIERIYSESNNLIEEQCELYCRRYGNCRRHKEEEEILSDLIF